MQELQSNNTKSTIATERAIDELRRSNGLIIQQSNGEQLGIIPLESLDAHHYARINSNSTQLLITSARAKYLGISSHTARIDTAKISWSQATAIADPTADQGIIPQLIALPTNANDYILLKLTKYASLLPALLIVPNPPKEWQSLSETDLQNYITHPDVSVIQTASAHLPLTTAENTRIISFRSAHASSTHLAIIIGEPTDSPITRIHSSCEIGRAHV